MIKLALVGKNIQHSKSREVYQSILKDQFVYELLDYSLEVDIPKIGDLLSQYTGINITSPYKQHFLKDIRCSEQALLLNAVNCICNRDGEIIGENTDYLAIINIIQNWVEKYSNLNIIILGDGVMSKVVSMALRQFPNIEFKIFSRKTSDHFNSINLIQLFQNEFKNQNQKLVINTCSREYTFEGKIDKSILFWDLNYGLEKHSQLLVPICQEYIDGMSMLILQAKFALDFFSIPY